MTLDLHIIEPTLTNTSGHCFTVVHSLASAVQQTMTQHRVHVWAGSGFVAESMQNTAINVHPYFHRRIRRLQLWWLLRGLAASGDIVLLPTAGRSELTVYAMLPKQVRDISNGNIWFYLHQLRMDGSRANRLQMLAKRISNVSILCTHSALVDIVTQAGFSNACLQPCPFDQPTHDFTVSPFIHLIFPGEARLDKNLPFITKIIRYLHEQDLDIPIMLQAGSNHHGQFSATITDALQEISNIGYKHLTMPQKSLAGHDYMHQFTGAICLQPYRHEDYASKISGITLDALTRGCPCIAAQDTWPANIVDEFSAGIVCEKLDVIEWIKAINLIIADYATYQQRCQQAMQILSQRHHPLRTIEKITGTKNDDNNS
ncbi:MAG: glycosyltransferase [Mariprofundales bacterium]